MVSFSRGNLYIAQLDKCSMLSYALLPIFIIKFLFNDVSGVYATKWNTQEEIYK